ncbi:hypothetical protein D9758_018704 [Tetrapyrgos nigripes]|uniref:Ubiquitin-like domain-containing protein n=1 Tax=Tetrapyrgos nigripes TaxID=182062 RepID=A0A8H5B7M1_9AGAR|nr:hypothetical protein D9758_018704 [Tetrapyrgos nigripes]
MTRIFLKDYHDERSYIAYDLSPNDTVWDLKKMLEVTKGIPTESQRLEFNDRALENSQTIDSNIMIPANALISLVPTPVLVELHWPSEVVKKLESQVRSYRDKQIVGTTELENENENGELTVVLPRMVTMDAGKSNFWISMTPTQSPNQADRNPSKSEPGVASLATPTPITMATTHKTFFEQGIREGDIIATDVVASSYYIPAGFGRMMSGCGGRRMVFPDYRAKVLYSWDGNMKHPSAEGLPLVAGSEFWFYCHRDYKPPAVITELDWIRNSGNEWIPTSFVLLSPMGEENLRKYHQEKEEEALKVSKQMAKILNELYGPLPSVESESLSFEGGGVEDEDKRKDKGKPDDESESEPGTEAQPHTDTEQHSSMDTPGPRPKLPLFPYPKPSIKEFHFHFADAGESFVTVMLETVELASPDDPAIVRVKLVSHCASGTGSDSRRITAISLCLRVPDNEIIDVQPRNRVVESTEKDTACWLINLMDDQARKPWNETGGTGTGMVADSVGEEEMSFVLSGKPVRFEYDCRVTHDEGTGTQEVVRQGVSREWFQSHFNGS